MESHKRWVLFSGLTSFFLSIAMLYQMSPFFQKYARVTTGATPDTVGLIFAVLPFSAFVFSVPAMGFIARHGPRVALASGLLLLACSSLMFGLSDTVSGWFFWRAVQGAATAPIYSSVAVMFANTFHGPGEFAWVNGIQEAMANIGFAVGPTMGGILFQWGGFFAPFAVSAVGHLLFVAFSLFAPTGAPPVDDQLESLLDDEEVVVAGLRDILTKEILLIIPAGIIIPGFFGSLDPVYAGHLLDSLGDISESTIGSLMGLPAVPSVGLALAVPFLMEKYSGHKVMTFGILLVSLTSILLGLSDPSAVEIVGWGLTLEPGSRGQWVLQVTLGLFVGSASVFGWTPVMPDMMEKAAKQVADRRGISMQAATAIVSPAVSSLFNAGAAIGEAVGPIGGGMLMARIGFAGTYVLLGLVFLIYGLALVMVPWSRSTEPHLPYRLPAATRLRTAVSVQDLNDPSPAVRRTPRAFSV